ncbi:MAG: phospholipase phosphocholine-specific, partial [Verrucomicrobiales bacterium]|nr:phospholipase phosphocholine-specific [Verrucomicrobiales bacterium]
LAIASPWTRGGAVCSQVFDHTSILQFLETWLTHKTGREVREPNISPWRRAVCGDLTSAFQTWQGEPVPLPAPVERTAWLGSLHQAQFKKLPGSTPLTPEELAAAQKDPSDFPRLPRQEKGLRPSPALPYELSVKSSPTADGRGIRLTFVAGKARFGARSAGAAFNVHARPAFAPGEPAVGLAPSQNGAAILPRAYTVVAGGEVSGEWAFSDFPDGRCRLEVRGPNGFFQSWNLAAGEPQPDMALTEKNAAGEIRHQLTLRVAASGDLPAGGKQNTTLTFMIEDMAYGSAPQRIGLSVAGPGSTASARVSMDCGGSRGWYDLRVTLVEFPGWERRFAGRIEDGLPGWSDPALGV